MPQPATGNNAASKAVANVIAGGNARKLAIKLFCTFSDFAGWKDGPLVEIGDGVLGVVAFEDFADPIVVVAVDRLADEAHAHIVALDDAINLGDARHHVVGGQDDAEVTANRSSWFKSPPATAGAPDLPRSRLPSRDPSPPNAECRPPAGPRPIQVPCGGQVSSSQFQSCPISYSLVFLASWMEDMQRHSCGIHSLKVFHKKCVCSLLREHTHFLSTTMERFTEMQIELIQGVITC